MRHGRKINHLGRTSSHRKAMLANMATSLIMHKRIKTTVPKAKALRMYVEPLINKSKDDTTHSRRIVFSYLQNKEAVTELFREISQKVADRPGGYTRILKLGNRVGDAAEICYIELVDYNENMLGAKEAKKTTTRRSRRGGGKKEAGAVASAAAPAAEKVAKAPKAAAKAVAEEAPVIEEVKNEVVAEEVAVIEEVKNEVVAEEAPIADATDEAKEE